MEQAILFAPPKKMKIPPGRIQHPDGQAAVDIGRKNVNLKLPVQQYTFPDPADDLGHPAAGAGIAGPDD